jgi:hypothetical protein
MKKKLTPATTERRTYVLLPDGTPARRLKPLIQGERKYWSLALSSDGKVKRVPHDRLAEFCEVITFPSENPNA